VRHIAEILGHWKLEANIVTTGVSMAKPQVVHARCN
jgi:hypothetical protein